MDWHCVEPETVAGIEYYNYLSVGANAVEPVSSLDEAITQCQAWGYSTAEVIQAGQQSLTAVIQQAMEIPDQATLEQIWMTGFALPVVCYLTAWGYQTVIAWFEHKGEH